MAIKFKKDSELDRFDRKILEIVALDGRIAITQLAKKLGMSATPCTVRLKRLIESNYILGFRALLNPQKLDLTHVAFVEVKLHDTTEAALSNFNAAVMTVPEIEQVHMIAGPFDYLLKVRTTDIQSYRKVLGERISTLPHVASSSTYVSMEAIKDGGITGS
ncbi:Lrp/AsnC ligand binding domain-containing protein [Roseibium porphyridii]|uniref:Lrp/AsnC ligand binding domain-containing protein n=1 Tax=Roseibium porphyridii TaxID=2866279 RepID=A0ABY8F341_9HYPH|nr:Lrp/AsnC ligand binding domain-containing protein [Roseibium sp. KMA01]WFE89891.1 Lrp/AsnC ligand binding domain-containing protein [Roseibium sp. KMA01]